jgi:hypothetical protein
MNIQMESLVRKWHKLLDGLTTDEQVKSMATLLENQEIYFNKQQFGDNYYLNEGIHTASNPVGLGLGGNTAGTSEIGGAGTPSGIARYKKMTIPLVRRIFPELLANQLVGVQPMTGPVGLAYALRYVDENNNELGYNTVDASLSGTTASGGFTTAEGEQLNEANLDLGSNGTTVSKEVGLLVQQKEIVARTRKLKARWSVEAQQDLATVNNVDLEEEMMDIMAYEIAAEIDRELVKRIINAAKAGGVLTWNPGTTDARWEQEKFRTLYTAIVTAAEEINRASRMGAGNWVVVSPKVAVALKSLGDFERSPVSSNVDPLRKGVSFIGTIGGMKVFRDTHAYQAGQTAEFAVVGYKGARENDTGLIYCPYIPVQFAKTIGDESFSPRAGVMTRYGICDHLFGSHNYYRYIDCTTGMAGINSVGTSVSQGSIAETSFFDSV